ncbi:MAG: DegT/DnrJ/EryC1/StrS family aminotransferase [Pyrinomonadaceae bacterium]
MNEPKNNGYNRRVKVSMSSPDITDGEVAAVSEVLRTRCLSIGPRIDQFEKAFADYVGVRYGVGVNSGTSGLHLAVIAAGVEQEDEVITPSFSFIASANCVAYERGRPVFVDVDPVTANMDVTLIEPAITSRTRAILVVHAFGQPAEMERIQDIAKRHGLALIEDACEAIGAEHKGRRVGTFGDTAVFAFYPNKQMTTGEGGMIVTDSDGSEALFRSLRNQGRDVFDAWLNHTRLGYNYRLDEMSAALGLVQLGRIDELLVKRECVAGWYNERLAGEEMIEVPNISPTTTRMSWFVYVVRIKPPASRDAVMRRLLELEIPSRPYFSPIHLQPFYREKFGYKRGELPVTEYLGEVSLALPFSGLMSEDHVDYVCSNLRRVVY